MAPRKIIIDGDSVFIYGTVMCKDGVNRDITFVHESDFWPILPVSVTTRDGVYLNVIESPRHFQNWRKRGDIQATEGRPKP